MTVEFSTSETAVVQAALRHLLDLCQRKMAVANALRHCLLDADQRTRAAHEYERFSASEQRIQQMLAKLEIKAQFQLATAA